MVPVKEVIAETESGKAVIKGVYRERYGKCSESSGARGGFGLETMRACNAARNDRWKFQMSIKLTNMELSSVLVKIGADPSREWIKGRRKSWAGR